MPSFSTPIVPMGAAEFCETIAELGLSILATGRFFGIHPRTAMRWAHGDSAVSNEASILLRLMLRAKMSPAHVRAIVDR